MAQDIKGFIVDGVQNPIVPDLATSATTAVSAKTAESIQGIGLNAKGNLEISNRNDSTVASPYTTSSEGDKVNITSAGSIQIKPGMKDASKAGEIALDNEFNTKDPYEIKVHACNGAKDSSGNDLFSNDTMGLKLNVAEITLDSKKACTSIPEGKTKAKFDASEMKVRVCTDKWNDGVANGSAGPIYAKWEARAHDIRCYGHGGVAIQIAGQDSDNHENKIKFESDRISNINETASYNGEGGKGVEFGTFNNLHTSLYTGDYRFKGDAMVYGVTRGELATISGKTDYPTQTDDFKDIVDSANGATWNEIIDVAKAYKNGTIGAGSSTSGDATPVELSAYVTKESYNAYTAATATELAGIATVDGKVDTVNNSPAMKYVTCDGEKVVIDATSIIVGYEYGDGTSGATETKDVLDESGNTTTLTGTAMNTAKVNLKSNRKISLKGKDGIEAEGASLIFPVEISKKNKVSCGDYEVSGLTTMAEIIAAMPKIGIAIEKNNSTIAEAAALGVGTLEVSILDLINLVSKVATLENKVADLEAKMAEYHPTETE